MESKADKEAEVDDLMKDADRMVKKLTGTLGDFQKMASKFNQIKEVDKVIFKVGSSTVIARMMSNGITTFEYMNKEDQKKHFDSLKKK